MASCHAIASHMTKSRSASRFVEFFRGFGVSSGLLPPRPPKRWEFLRKVAALLSIPLPTPESDDKS
jgi:hypothetical protein